MITKIGRKLVQGAKAEIQEGPKVEIFDTDKILDLIEAVAVLGGIALLIFGGCRSLKKPVTVVNNIYINGIKQ